MLWALYSQLSETIGWCPLLQLYGLSALYSKLNQPRLEAVCCFSRSYPKNQTTRMLTENDSKITYKYMGNQVPLSFQIGFENGFAISENIALLIVIRFFQKHQASLCLRQALFDRESFDFVFRQSLLLEYLLNENLVLKFQITSPRVFTGCNARWWSWLHWFLSWSEWI